MMKTRSEIRDEDGTVWEIHFDQLIHYQQEEGKPAVALPSTVHDFEYRKQGAEEWLPLPPWATVKDGAAINLCVFDEDEETGELMPWVIQPGEWD